MAANLREAGVEDEAPLPSWGDLEAEMELAAGSVVPLDPQGVTTLGSNLSADRSDPDLVRILSPDLRLANIGKE
eukprot:5823568-Heterocapsa_arctica.AAC.1